MKHFFIYSKTYEFKKQNFFIENGKIFDLEKTK